MARQPTPDGRRVHMNVKFSEAEAAAVDEARGDAERGTWLRETALRGLPFVVAHDSPVKRARARAAATLAVGPQPEVPAPPPPAGPRVPAGTATAVFQPAGAEPVVTHAVPAKNVDEAREQLDKTVARKSAAKGQCEHRVKSSSYCTRCGRLI